MTFFNKKPNKQIFDYNGNRIYINGLLLSIPGFKEPKSLNSKGSVSYDDFAEQLTDKFVSKLIKHVNTSETKQLATEITETLVFALNNLSNIPSTLRDYFFNVTTVFVEFLKKAVSYSETDVVSDQIKFYLPLLKQLISAVKTFLTNNK